MKRVVYDYEFIEDYHERDTRSLVSAPGYTPSIPLSPFHTDKELWWLEDNEGGNDDIRQEEHHDLQPWGPKEYNSLQHPLSLMVGQA